jgi:hypothetical protein
MEKTAAISGTAALRALEHALAQGVRLHTTPEVDGVFYTATPDYELLVLYPPVTKVSIRAIVFPNDRVSLPNMPLPTPADYTALEFFKSKLFPDPEPDVAKFTPFPIFAIRFSDGSLIWRDSPYRGFDHVGTVNPAADVPPDEQILSLLENYGGNHG